MSGNLTGEGVGISRVITSALASETRVKGDTDMNTEHTAASVAIVHAEPPDVPNEIPVEDQTVPAADRVIKVTESLYQCRYIKKYCNNRFKFGNDDFCRWFLNGNVHIITDLPCLSIEVKGNEYGAL
jgi:hypothetical protein